MLSPEERHLVKIADVDTLECLACGSGEHLDIFDKFEAVFVALDKRSKIDREVVLEWGAATRCLDRRILRTRSPSDCGNRVGEAMFEIAIALGRTDLAKALIETVVISDAPIGKDGRWWEHQHDVLNNQAES